MIDSEVSEISFLNSNVVSFFNENDWLAKLPYESVECLLFLLTQLSSFLS